LRGVADDAIGWQPEASVTGPTTAKAEPAMTDDIGAIVDWLVDGARSAPRPDMVLEQLCAKLIAAGLPISRAGVFVSTLHPNIVARRFLWKADAGAVEIGEASFKTAESDAYRDSPIAYVYAHGVPIRRRLADPDCPLDFTVLADLRQEGVTDYLIQPLIFTWGAVHAASWATRRPGGFTEAQIAALGRIEAPLTRVAEIRAREREAVNLLNAYVGGGAGERILAGRIRRGDVETIRAAIWLSDMRGFTALADRLPPPELIALLNRYFDCQVPAIHRQGGEVLKFMGDGLLAIFPLPGGDRDTGAACGRALVAAREARDAVAMLRRDDTAGDERVRCGIALHVGDVLYGNIGGENRLDFTCIGPGVNLAARLEKLTARLQRTILASAAFAPHCTGDFVPLGEFAIAGFAAPQIAYGLAEEAG
jgi:adenylate cyclase